MALVEEFARVREIRSEVVRRNELEHLFFEGWQIGEGCLNYEARGRVLPIFHDSLGQEPAARFARA